MTNAKAESMELVNEIIPLATQTLGKYGEFAPVGLALDVNGEIVMVAVGDQREATAPTAQELIDVIKDGFIEGARSGKFKATALAYEAILTSPDDGRKADAIAVALDHREGYSAIAYFRYTRKGKDVIVEQDAAAERGPGEIFSE